MFTVSKNSISLIIIFMVYVYFIAMYIIKYRCELLDCVDSLDV